MLACALFCLPVIGSPNYIVNGGFETGATAGVLSPTLAGPPNNYLIYVFGVGGATDIGGWTVSNGPNSNGSTTPLSVLVTGNPPQPPAGGSYAVDFDPFWNISTGELLGPTVTGTLPELSQTMILPAGDYLLSFDGALETGGAVGTRSLGVTLTGAATLNQTATTSMIDAAGYQLFTYDFSTAGGSVTLTFIPDDFSAEPNFMLDNVSVTAAVPEPATGYLVAGVLCILAGRAKRVSRTGRIIWLAYANLRRDLPRRRRGPRTARVRA
jgi:hypothetical protein